MKTDFLIVGSGLTGATIARTLIDSGCDVLLVERREHVGGNVHDHRHHTGISIHTYGPHYFRTSSDYIWDFVNRFDTFYDYQAVILSKVFDEHVHWPLWSSEFNKYADDLTLSGVEQPQNLEEAALKIMPKRIYEMFVKEYNEKQWGVEATKLSADLARRFEVRTTPEPRLKPDAKYQGIPTNGYAQFMSKMVDGIRVIHGDFLSLRRDLKFKHLVYTGPIDLFFESKFGPLSYRGQQRTIEHFSNVTKLPCGQVNYPMHIDGPHIRKLEWKHMMDGGMEIAETIITTETPFTPTDPDQFEYPFPDIVNAERYSKYRQLAEEIRNVTIAGRLGEYKYYDMDQAIARAMKLANGLLCSYGINKRSSHVL
jgi:UDP-galactopyranose mutase